MSGMQSEYNYLKSGQWAERNPLTCPCRGGWLLSDLDTWHKCPIHGFDGMTHPEAEECFDGEVDMQAAYDHEDKLRTEHFRKMYRQIRKEARDEGFTGDFDSECATEVNRMAGEATPAKWVAAACKVAEDFSEWLASAIEKAEQDQYDYEPEGPGITEPYEVAYGPRW